MADILQKIKVIADTAAATRNLKDVKDAQNQIPKLLKIATLNHQAAISAVRTSMLQLAAVATATFAILYKGFVGIGEDVKSVNQMNTAILTMGIQANVSAKSLFSYFETLLNGIGLSASALGTMAQGFISAGANTLNQIRQLTLAAVGLAKRTGIATLAAADKLQKAMMGNTKGLKLFGIAAKEGQSAQDALNEALRQGAISFNNIDTNSPLILIARMKLSFDNMIKELASSFVPVFTPVFNFIIKNMDTIGKVLTTGAIFIGTRQVYKVVEAINTAYKAQLGLLGVISSVQYQKLLTRQAEYNAIISSGLTLRLNEQRALDIINLKITHHNANLTIKNRLIAASNMLLNSTNIILLAITIATQVLITNWDKIKNTIAGTTKELADAKKSVTLGISDIQKQRSLYNILAGSLLSVADAHNKNSVLYKAKQKYINDLNTQYSKYLPHLLTLKSSYDDIKTSLDKITKSFDDLIQKKMQNMMILISLKVNEDKIKTAVLKLAKLNQQIEEGPKKGVVFTSADPNKAKQQLQDARNNWTKQRQQLVKLLQTQINNWNVESIDLAKKLVPIDFGNILSTNDDNIGIVSAVSKSKNTMSLLTKDSYGMEDFTLRLKLMLNNVDKMKLVFIGSADTILMYNQNILLSKNKLKLLIDQKNLLVDAQNALIKTWNELSAAAQEKDNTTQESIKLNKLLIASIDLKIKVLKEAQTSLSNTIGLYKSITSLYSNYLSMQSELAKIKYGLNSELYINSLKEQFDTLVILSAAMNLNNSTLMLRISILKLLLDLNKRILSQDNGLAQAAELKKSEVVSTFALIGNSITSSITTAIQTAASAVGNAFADMIVHGKNFGLSMKNIWKNMIHDMIANLTKLLLFKGLSMLFNIIFPGSGAFVKGIFTGLTGGTGATTGSGGGLLSNNTGTSNTGNTITYMGQNSISKKLDAVVAAIETFNPVYTQVIDLPTLSRANTMGAAMQLNSI